MIKKRKLFRCKRNESITSYDKIKILLLAIHKIFE